MIYYISTPFGDNRALVSLVEPDSYLFTTDKIPDGSGTLVVINNELVRLPDPIPPEPDNLEKRVDDLETAFDTLTEGLV